jgi:hypothetical protein
MTEQGGRKRPVNSALDRKVLLTYLSVLVLVLLGAAMWTSLILGRSSPVVVGAVAVAALVFGTITGRGRRPWLRWLGMGAILVILILLANRATPEHSYQFAWLFPSIAGLILARPEWPWWKGAGDGG